MAHSSKNTPFPVTLNIICMLKMPKFVFFQLTSRLVNPTAYLLYPLGYRVRKSNVTS